MLTSFDEGGMTTSMLIDEGGTTMWFPKLRHRDPLRSVCDSACSAAARYARLLDLRAQRGPVV
jgi:hypothetical protein